MKPDTSFFLSVDHAVRASVAALPSLEFAVVSRLYGLDGSEPIDAVEIAAELGTTPERVNEVHASALRTLRDDRWES